MLCGHLEQCTGARKEYCAQEPAVVVSRDASVEPLAMVIKVDDALAALFAVLSADPLEVDLPAARAESGRAARQNQGKWL